MHIEFYDSKKIKFDDRVVAYYDKYTKQLYYRIENLYGGATDHPRLEEVFLKNRKSYSGYEEIYAWVMSVKRDFILKKLLN